MRDWEPIGAGGESGYTAGDPLHPGHRLRRHGSALRPRARTRRSPARRRRRSPEPARARLDAAARVLEGRSARALLRESVSLQDDRRREDAGRRSAPISRVPIRAFRRTLDAAAAAQTDRNGKRGVIYTIAPSPLRAPMVWVGTDDGLIQLTTDDGKTWQNVTPPALTPWSRVTMIEASHFDANAAYASVDRHQLAGLRAVHLSHARHAARRWQTITNGLPAGVYVHVGEGRSAAPRPAVRRHRARRVRLVRRRRQLAAAAAQPAGRRRCATSRSTATISSSRRTAAASG